MLEKLLNEDEFSAFYAFRRNFGKFFPLGIDNILFRLFFRTRP
jgi:hypothetical protein